MLLPLDLGLVTAIAVSPKIASTVREKGFGVADTAYAAADGSGPAPARLANRKP